MSLDKNTTADADRNPFRGISAAHQYAFRLFDVEKVRRRRLTAMDAQAITDDLGPTIASPTTVIEPKAWLSPNVEKPFSTWHKPPLTEECTPRKAAPATETLFSMPELQLLQTTPQATATEAPVLPQPRAEYRMPAEQSSGKRAAPDYSARDVKRRVITPLGRCGEVNDDDDDEGESNDDDEGESNDDDDSDCDEAPVASDAAPDECACLCSAFQFGMCMQGTSVRRCEKAHPPRP